MKLGTNKKVGIEKFGFSQQEQTRKKAFVIKAYQSQ